VTVAVPLDKRELMVFGEGVFAEAPLDGRGAVLFTMPEPLALLSASERARFARIELVTSMERSVVEDLTASLDPGIGLSVGFGGGSALDMAKYAAWSRGVPAILVPSILSVDACVTATAAVRDQGRVRYVANVVPEAIYIDYTVLRSAPQRLNRAGAADILSIHTALFDWELAARRTGERYDADIAQRARELVRDLVDAAPEIRACSQAGLRFLAEAFAIEDHLCTRHGNSRPEEGSEHFLAYAIEHRTRRSFIHGELVGLGIVVMSHLQGNDPESASRHLHALGIPHDLRHLGIDLDTLSACVADLPAYCEAEALAYSIANELDPGTTDARVRDVEALFLRPEGGDAPRG
jgi:glycerol-1-phosphate dehydrogenase [NAD(P)+]